MHNKTNPIRIWQLIIAFFVFGLLAILSLRQNSLKTIELRDDVLASDEVGVGTEEAIKKLGDHIISSMNSNMAGPIQLPNTFNRDYEELVLSSESLTNSEYLEIREECVNFEVPVEVQSECIRNETKQITDQEFSLAPELYSFNYRSPFWSPDMAGLLTLLTVVIGVAIAVRLTSARLVKSTLKKHL